MKGVIFQLLQEVVTTAHGEAAWDDLLIRAELPGIYTSLGLYDDDELTRLVTAGSEAFAIPPRQLIRWVGRNAIPFMVQRWPRYFEANQSTLPLLWSLNSVIHPEVRKLYAGAICPHFDFEAEQRSELFVGYSSPRKLCDLAHGFIEGVAGHYHETVTVGHLKCMHDGDEKCLMAVHLR